MKKWIKINGKEHVIKIRETFAPKEKGVNSKKVYTRKAKHKKNLDN
jgi:hypothetical protein